MSDPTNTTPPAVPEWAERAMYALQDAVIVGGSSDGHWTDDRLTQAERDLIDAASLLLRTRLGLSKIKDPNGTAAFLIRRALGSVEAGS